MNYSETLEFLYNQLPMYQRIGKEAYKADLNNTIKLCNLLNNPQNNFKSIHIAGTNGKGSVAHSIASVLQEAGYKTGLYTSPHLKDYRERIRINGEMITEKFVTDFVNKYKNEFLSIELSFFEMTVGLAFKYFQENQVDIAVIETGMGGRLDSTNIIRPELSIITNISFDHTQFLGDSLEEIAKEKAGIIKEKVEVIIGETQKETKDIFINFAKEKNTTAYFADQIIRISKSYIERNTFNIYKNKNLLYNDISLGLKGNCQTKNLKTIIEALEILKNKGFNFSYENIKQGILNTTINTGLKGRWQKLDSEKLIFADTGHNFSGIKETISNLNYEYFENAHFILGFTNDKKLDDILNLYPKDGIYYFCKPNIPRGLNANNLKEQASKIGLKGEVYNSVKEAFESANKNSSEKDLILIGGSTFVVAEII